MYTDHAEQLGSYCQQNYTQRPETKHPGCNWQLSRKRFCCRVSSLLMQNHCGIDGQTAKSWGVRYPILFLVPGSEPDWIVIQCVGRAACVVVVHADVVSSRVVGLREEIAQTDCTEAARQVHFALTAEETT